MVESNRKMTGFLIFFFCCWNIKSICDWLSLTTTVHNKNSLLTQQKKNSILLFFGYSKLSHLPHQMSESALNLARVQCPLVTLCAKFSTLSRNVVHCLCLYVFYFVIVYSLYSLRILCFVQISSEDHLAFNRRTTNTSKMSMLTNTTEQQRRRKKMNTQI